jgi:hypothetical protein
MLHFANHFGCHLVLGYVNEIIIINWFSILASDFGNFEIHLFDAGMLQSKIALPNGKRMLMENRFGQETKHVNLLHGKNVNWHQNKWISKFPKSLARMENQLIMMISLT